MEAGGSKRALAAMALLSVAVVSAGCGQGTGPGGGLRTGPGAATSSSHAPANLSVELDWVPNPDHVGLYYAQDKGYFADRGLTVAFHSPSNPADPIKLVGLNKVDLAISYEPEMFYAQEHSLPVVAVATVVPVPLNALIVAPGVSAPSLAAMKGKSIGVTGVPSDDAFFQTMLKTAGLTASEVTKVNVGVSLVQSILSHKVDGIIGGYRNVEAIQIQQESGEKPTVYPAHALGIPTYAELVLVANAGRLETDAGYASSVRRFVAALVRGTDAAIADPSGATDIIKRDTQYDPTFLDESVPLTLKFLAPVAGIATGCINRSNWQSYGDWMKSTGLITDTPDAASITSNRYLPAGCT